MSEWTSDELSKIEAVEELQIASGRQDGALRKPVTIWVVCHAAWFRGAQVRREEHIQAGGVDKDITFLDDDHDIDGQIEAAYRTKYRRYTASTSAASRALRRDP